MRKVSLFFTNALRQQPAGAGGGGGSGTHQTLLKETTNEQDAICQVFLLLADLLSTMLPAGHLCWSSRTWIPNIFFQLALGILCSTAGQWHLLCPSASLGARGSLLDASQGLSPSPACRSCCWIDFTLPTATHNFPNLTVKETSAERA